MLTDVSMWRSLGKKAAQAAVDFGTQELKRRLGERGSAPKPGPSRSRRKTARPAAPRPKDGYLGDYTGRVRPSYEPEPDGDADPGEVVWAWVPYEEDHSQGKDRPVLVVARLNGHLLALPLTSKDHDRDAEQERRAGRTWMDVGTGAWDRRRRPSEVRLDRVLQLRYSDVRREGATLDKGTFDAVIARVERANNWSAN